MTWAVDELENGKWKRIFLEESKAMADAKVRRWPNPTKVYEDIDGDRKYNEWLASIL